MVENNPHYKGIYFSMHYGTNKMVMIGTDRILSFWDVELDQDFGASLILDNKIPSLGGVVTDIIIHQTEK